jgi:enterochelin esterase-like enzyme
MKKRISLVLLVLIFFVNPAWTQAKSKVDFTKMTCTMLNGISEREYTIYLPPSYNTNKTQTYPVLYLLHGGNCSNTDWAVYGGLQTTADSLIANGLCKEMIIVCPEGNKNNMIWFNASHWKYEDFFFKEFVPFIENHYRVISDKKHRAVAGYSMGGGASVVYGAHHPEMFNTVYGMSSYLISQDLAFLKKDSSAAWRQQIIDDNNPIKSIQSASATKLDSLRKVHWFIDCGDDDFTYDANIDLISVFRLQNIRYQLRIKDGGHDWNYWRPSLKEALIIVSNNMK